MRSLYLTLLAIFLSHSAIMAQKALTAVDISQNQLHLMQQYRNKDSINRSKVFINSIYEPYKKFWNDYLGEADDVSGWLDKAMSKLPEWQAKNKNIQGKQLVKQLKKVAKDLEKLTGYAAHGNWYIVYGPAWTDLGGLSNSAMVIDLAHNSNGSNEKIARMFPHELTHQIMANVNKHKDTTAISSIIGEGFAVWMNQKYFGEKFTLAQHLGYTQEELALADSYLDKLKGFFERNKYSADKDMINAFRNRSAKLNENLPGAIGYYIGYKIVDGYVKKNGPESWKDIFVKSPREISENSGFIKPAAQ